MNVLITGGNGDIAKQVAVTLGGLSGYEVFSPSRHELDVTDQISVAEFFVEHYIDTVVNCAGTLYSSLITESEPEFWINDIQTNLIGTYLVTRMALIKNKHCRVVNVASTAAFNAYKDWTSYCAAKAGVIKLTQGLHKDGYDVLAICPGAIDTKLREGLTIANPNLMTLAEGVAPIIAAITSDEYKAGDIVFYRKGTLQINPDFALAIG